MLAPGAKLPFRSARHIATTERSQSSDKTPADISANLSRPPRGIDPAMRAVVGRTGLKQIDQLICKARGMCLPALYISASVCVAGAVTRYASDRDVARQPVIGCFPTGKGSPCQNISCQPAWVPREFRLPQHRHCNALSQRETHSAKSFLFLRDQRLCSAGGQNSARLFSAERMAIYFAPVC